MLNCFAARTTIAPLLALACALTGAARASAAPQTGSQLSSPEAYPADTGTTHNNGKAAIRHADPTNSSEVVSVWGLNTGNLIKTFGHPLSISPMLSGSRVSVYGARGYRPSDQIELTNTRVVSIGSGSSSGNPYDDETYIEVVDLVGMSAYPQRVIAPGGGGLGHNAGYANDLAITREGGLCTINSDNWIHIIQTGNANLAQSFNTGVLDYSFYPNAARPWSPGPRPCSPNGAVDSVAVTNDIAVVTTARITGNYVTTWVYLVDLVSLQVVLQYEIPNSVAGEAGADFPHDVTITPSEELAVVTTTHATALFDLVNYAPLGYATNQDHARRYQKQVDSVEVTDKNAVVIADWTNSSTQKHFWEVQVFGINLGSGLTHVATYTDANWASTDPLVPESRAHDLAIDIDNDLAVVRTSYGNVVVSGLSTPAPTKTELPSTPIVSDAYAYEMFLGGGQGQQFVFSSDAVVITRMPNAGLMAATIGGHYDANGVCHGVVDLIDLTTLTLSQSASIDSNGGPSDVGCVPLDLAVSHDHQEIVVRSADPHPDSANAPGADVVRVSLTSGAFTATFGGDGGGMGLDAIANQASGLVNTTVKRVLTTSSDPGIGGVYGYFHLSL